MSCSLFGGGCLEKKTKKKTVGGAILEDQPRTNVSGLITMVSKSPKDRVVGPLPNDLLMAFINGGY